MNNNKVISYFLSLLFLTLSPFYAGAGEVIRQDQITFGRPDSTAKKILRFDTGNSPNALIAVDDAKNLHIDNAANIGLDEFGLDLAGALSFSSINQVNANRVIDSYMRAFGCAVRGVCGSSSSGNFTTTSTTFVDVTNLSITLTTSGRPILVLITGVGGSGYFSISGNTSPAGGWIIFKEGGTTFGGGMLTSTGGTTTYPPMLFAISGGVAGGHTFKVQAAVQSGATIGLSSCTLRAFEL